MVLTDSSPCLAAKPCLYCGDTSAMKTDEHVVQEALGGSVVLADEACGPCNTKVFSPLDGHLVRIVRDLLCHNHPDVPKKRMFIAGDHCVTRDEENSVWVTVRLDQKLRPVVFEQMVQLPDGTWHVSMDPSIAGNSVNAVGRVHKMADELAGVCEENISMKVVAGTEPPVEPAIIRSAPGVFVVRAAYESQATALRSAILAGRFATNTLKQLSDPRSQSTQSPVVHIRKAVEQAAIERALAKLAINVACHALGSTVVRSQAFDAIRRFARFGDGYGDEPFACFPSIRISSGRPR